MIQVLLFEGDEIVVLSLYIDWIYITHENQNCDFHNKWVELKALSQCYYLCIQRIVGSIHVLPFGYSTKSSRNWSSLRNNQHLFIHFPLFQDHHLYLLFLIAVYWVDFCIFPFLSPIYLLCFLVWWRIKCRNILGYNHVQLLLPFLYDWHVIDDRSTEYF